MEFNLYILAFSVLLIAFFYGSVGLGGGSSYTALFAIVGLPYAIIPTLSLSLNTVVTLIATWQFARKGFLKPRLLMPFIATSIPFAYLGGRLDLNESVFQVVLLVSLIAVAFRIYWWKNPVLSLPKERSFQWGLSLIVGSILGFVAGTVGIGGGIYLIPIIILTGLGTAKEAAATGAAFILLNSIVGLSARTESISSLPWESMWPLAVSVLVGGYAGSRLGAGKWEPQWIQQVLGGIILVAIVILSRSFLL